MTGAGDWMAGRVRLVDPAAGAAVHQLIVDPDRLVATLGEQLRALHGVPLEGCPAATSVDLLIEEATLRVEHGAVDPGLFDDAYQRYTPQRLLEVAQRMRPAEPEADPVLVHGAAKLESLRGDGAGAWAWTASPRLGAGDRYRDLATLSIDLATVVSPQALGPFFDAYGAAEVDLVRLDFHVLLDQLLR